MPPLLVWSFFLFGAVFCSAHPTGRFPAHPARPHSPIRQHAVSVVPPVAPAASYTVSVIALGGDPTGKNDSAAAFDAAIAAAASLSPSNDLPSQIGSGGVTIDLGGGTYTISRPIVINGSSHNGFTISGGSIVADASVWPAGGCLLDIFGWVSGLALVSLTLDGAHAACGVHLDAVLQLQVERVFFIHYSTFGIHGDDSLGASHELMVSDCFFAEFMWGEPGYNDILLQNGTAIWLEKQFYDSNFYNSIIRCTRMGVVSLAGANLLHGLHIYATCNKNPDGYNVSIGLLVGRDANAMRITNCYFDDSPVVLLSLNEIILTENMIYGLSGLVFAPQYDSLEPTGLLISNNVFDATPYSGVGPRIELDLSNGTIQTAALRDVHVYANSISNASMARASRVSVTLLASASVSTPLAGTVLQVQQLWGSTTYNGTIDFRDSLLFPPSNASYYAVKAPAVFNWRASAGKDATARIIAGGRDESRRSGGRRSGFQGALSADAFSFGGAFAQLQASAVLTNLSLSGSSLPLLGSGLTPVYALYPTDVAGVLEISVALQTFGGGPSAAWLARFEDALERSAESNATAIWEAFITISVDQSLPTDGGASSIRGTWN